MIVLDVKVTCVVLFVSLRVTAGNYFFDRPEFRLGRLQNPYFIVRSQGDTTIVPLFPNTE